METHVNEEEPGLGHSVERTFQQEEQTPGLEVGLSPTRRSEGTEGWVVSAAVGVPPQPSPAVASHSTQPLVIH